MKDNRYFRQTILPEIGESGQKKLSDSSVLIVGLGGLGCPASLYLAAAGVGRLGLCDPDRVDITNLHRQVLYSVADTEKFKVDQARIRLSGVNPEMKLVEMKESFDESFSTELLSSFDLVLDATDNFKTRYHINKLCHDNAMPMVYGALHKFEGQVAVFNSAEGPCYNCLFPEDDNQAEIPDCATAGVLGVLPGIIGSMQALECLKVLLGSLGAPLTGKLLLYDALEHKTRTIAHVKDPECKVCSLPSRKKDTRAAIDRSSNHLEEGISADELRTMLAKSEKDKSDDVRKIKIIDVRTHEEHLVGRIPGSICIPLDELEEWVEDNGDQKSCYLVYCQSGARSTRALHLMLSKGYTDVKNLIGGYQAWSLIHRKQDN